MNNCEKCGYYSDGECNICGMGMSDEDTFCRLCKDNPNCYYKQLSELKAENERLKEEINEYKKHSKCAWKCFEGTLCEEGEKYKQTLQEIKAIAKGVRGYLEVPSPRDVRFEMDRILDLITKAEEE